MHILRNLILKIALLTVILLIIFAIFPLLLDIDPYRPKLLEQVAKTFPGELKVAHSKFALLPRPAILLKDLSIDVTENGETARVLRAPESKMLLSLRPLLKEGAIQFTLVIPKATLHFGRFASGHFQIHPLYDMPYKLNRKVTTNSKEGLSWFEKIQITGLFLNEASLPEGALHRLAVDFAPGGWNISFRAEGSTIPLTHTLATCEGTDPKRGVEAQMVYKQNVVLVTKWKQAENGFLWTGSFDENGAVRLQSQSKRVEGVWPQLICK